MQIRVQSKQAAVFTKALRNKKSTKLKTTTTMPRGKTTTKVQHTKQ